MASKDDVPQTYNAAFRNMQSQVAHFDPHPSKLTGFDETTRWTSLYEKNRWR